MITMISVSSFKLTLSATSLLFLSLSRCTVWNESFPVLLLFIIPPPYFNHSVSQPVAHSLTHSLTLSLSPAPICLPLLYLSLYLSFHSLHFHLNFQCLGHTRLLDAWLLPQKEEEEEEKILKSFPAHRKRRRGRRGRKKIIIICLGKFISIFTANTHTLILTMCFDVPILGVYANT